MKYFLRITVLVLVFFSQTAFNFERIDYKDGRYKNVCKDLRNDVLLYFIFVDSKDTSPWTEFDIQSTLDSITVAIEWIERQAKKYNIPLNIKTDYYIGEQTTTIKKRLPEPSVFETVSKPNLQQGLLNINDWADKIAKEAGAYQPIIKKDGIPEVEKPKNKERLIAYLRDKHNVESVALLFMVNNYFKEDISVPVNTMTTYDVEFAVVSYKYPAEIAHNFLHLYGAADLNETIYRRNKNKIELAKSLLSNDIMQDTYSKNINYLEISEYTRYLIGWTNQLETQYRPLLKDNLTVNF